jgi:hypothetical protein
MAESNATATSQEREKGDLAYSLSTSMWPQRLQRFNLKSTRFTRKIQEWTQKGDLGRFIFLFNASATYA